MAVAGRIKAFQRVIKKSGRVMIRKERENP